MTRTWGLTWFIFSVLHHESQLSILFSRPVCEPDLRSAVKGRVYQQCVNDQSSPVVPGGWLQASSFGQSGDRGERARAKAREAGGWRKDGKGLRGGEGSAAQRLNLTRVQPLLGLYSTTGHDRKVWLSIRHDGTLMIYSNSTNPNDWTCLFHPYVICKVRFFTVRM